MLASNLPILIIGKAPKKGREKETRGKDQSPGKSSGAQISEKFPSLLCFFGFLLVDYHRCFTFFESS
jgi:hypothetical protein